MKMFLLLLLTSVCALGAESDLRVFSYAETNAEIHSVYLKEVFLRNGQTNLVRTTTTRTNGVVRTFRFYHGGQVVANFIAAGAPVDFNTEAGPYCVSLHYGAAGEITAAAIGTKEGEWLDEFSYTNGVFTPVPGPIHHSGLMKPKFGSGLPVAQKKAN